MKDTWRATLLADVYAVLSAILKRDVSKKQRVAILEVAGGRPN